MECPFCGGSDFKVIDSRQVPATGEVRRLRQCKDCFEKFSTVERISSYDVTVAKSGGRPPERFSRTQVRKGIEKAAAKVELNSAEVDAVVERVVRRIRPTPSTPVTSSSIGDLVLKVLSTDRREHVITRIRFALVFLGRTSRSTRFNGVQDFLRWLGAEYGEPTKEQPTTTPAWVIDRDGLHDSYQITKLERGIGIAAKGRGDDGQVAALATAVAAQVTRELHGQAIVSSQQIAGEVLKALKQRDHLAYLRYAAAVKRYRSVEDFWIEANALLQEPPPTRRPQRRPN